MPRPARVSPDRILAAAGVEFAERGYGGARVDRIARRARVNKAMLYYHFRSKQGLYRALLRRTFSDAAARIRAIAESPGHAAEKVDRVIEGIAALIEQESVFPAIMLREVAEGGAHLDRETLLALVGVPRAVGEIVRQGIAEGAFRPVHPLFAHLTMVAPIVFYLAAGPIRKELGAMPGANMQAPGTDEFVRHMQDVMRRALAHRAPERPTS